MTTGFAFDNKQLQKAIKTSHSKSVDTLLGDERFRVEWCCRRGTIFCTLQIDLILTPYQLSKRGQKLFDKHNVKYVDKLFNNGRKTTHWRVNSPKVYIWVNIKKDDITDWVDFLIKLLGDRKNICKRKNLR